MAIFPGMPVSRLSATALGALANQPVSINVPAPPVGKVHYLFGISASYTNTSGVGLLTISVAGQTVFQRRVMGQWDLPTFAPIPMGGQGFTVTLSAGGASQTGHLNVWGDVSIPPNAIE
jgi:hypothetical protein